MIKLDTICSTLAALAPLRLAESWDNVGLLVGDRTTSVERLMTCLTITPDVVDEAVERNADLIVTHHPLPFQPLKKITADSSTGRVLLQLIASGVAVYSAHTAFDSAAQGINQSWADELALSLIAPLTTTDEESLDGLGSGRFGDLESPTSLSDLADRAVSLVSGDSARVVGDPADSIQRVALACGSGGSFLAAAARRGCDAMITGEATFHTCLEAEAQGIGLVLLGHYNSERFAMERLAEALAAEHADLTVWASRAERNPIRTFFKSNA